MKTKPEFRKVALDFAKRNGFDNVHFCGMLGKVDGPGADIEVYTGGYKTPCVVGLPQVILTDGKTAKFDKSGEPFKILDSCRKLPKVVFEYDYMCFFGGSHRLILLENGRLIREDNNFEDLVINSPELAKAVKKLIKENKEELEKLPKEISNSHILDSAGETFRFGRLKIEGSNILTESMEGYEEALKKYNAVKWVGKKIFYTFSESSKSSRPSSMNMWKILFSMEKKVRKRRNKHENLTSIKRA